MQNFINNRRRNKSSPPTSTIIFPAIKKKIIIKFQNQYLKINIFINSEYTREKSEQ